MTNVTMKFLEDSYITIKAYDTAIGKNEINPGLFMGAWCSDVKAAKMAWEKEITAASGL